jgi:protoporphyrinogen oxidase
MLKTQRVSPLPVAIVGGGPAGLTAAYCLAKKKLTASVLEADPEYLGGISRTVKYKGYSFDIGGHRFFSKAKEIEDFWTEILPNDMLTRPRSSRIYYNGQFFSYPLKGLEALRKLGIAEAVHCVSSYVIAKAAPNRQPKNYQEWVTNEFGARLFEIFFKTYTEKVWGMKCHEISADWAAQRIKGLSLSSAIRNALLPKMRTRKSTNDEVIKTLIDSFRYPRKGPGMLWEECGRKIAAMGGEISMGKKVTSLRYDAMTREWTVGSAGQDGALRTMKASSVISSMPMRQLARALCEDDASPRLSPKARKAAEALRYRDFITVVLMMKDRNLFQDNWIYIHDPKVKVGRVQNFKSWSPEMVPSSDMACFGLEYFCFEGDGLWTQLDKSLIELATRELQTIGLANPGDVTDGYVVRQPKAYPVYDDTYEENVEVLRRELEEKFPSLYLIGRNGMHKYNNQDHAMMTAMLTAENIEAGARIYDVWSVNQDAEYHEAGNAGSGSIGGPSTFERQVPARAKS